MLATVIHGPRDIRVEEVPDPVLHRPTDAVVRIVASCVCGSDLWPYRGVTETEEPRRIGHEFVGVVEDVGKPSRQLPGLEERLPVDALDQFAEVVGVEGPEPEEARPGRHVALPRDRGAVGPGDRERLLEQTAVRRPEGGELEDEILKGHEDSQPCRRSSRITRSDFNVFSR